MQELTHSTQQDEETEFCGVSLQELTMKLMKKAVTAEKSPEFLENKRMKKWVDESDHNGFMLFPRSLYITWGGHQNWDWNCFKETGDENVEVAKLSHVCWLDVRGKFSVSLLSPGIAYEIVYEVKLKKEASGWELPITLKLSLPNGEVRERQVLLVEKPRNVWIELNVGNLVINEGETGEVCFDMMEHGGHWKTGLIIKAAILRPKKITMQ